MSDEKQEPFLQKIEDSVRVLEASNKGPPSTLNLQEWLGKKFVEADLVNLFENAPDGIVVIDSTGLIVGVNSRVEEIFGWRRLEMLAKSVDMLVPDDLKCTHDKGREEFFKNPRVEMLPFGIFTFGKHKDGSRIPIHITRSFVKTHYEVLGTAFVRLRRHSENQ